MTSCDADILVVGGGIVGLSTAMQLTQRFPQFRIVVVEKEADLAAHQTGHNSGVVHAGVYYEPGSLKARLCREGSDATYAFCREHGIKVERRGKLIVATNDLEITRLDALYERCLRNGLEPALLDRAELTRLEPRIVGRRAIRVASSGITDYPGIARAMADVLKLRGGEIKLKSQVMSMQEQSDAVIVETPSRTLRARYAVVCAGLMADRLAKMCGVEVDFLLVPFRGEYFRLPSSMNDIVSHMIYPVPNPELPFLGIHLTPMIGGYVTVGPNAVLALAREGYRWRDWNWRDLAEMAAFPGMRRLLRRQRRSATRELLNSVFKRGYLAECRKYCPELRLADLESYPAGVRAQAVTRDGGLIHDFLLRRGRRTLHVCNAPSPAATSALPIGRYLIEQCVEAFEWSNAAGAH
jgi:L-2-hydroxyglutarate oxidase